MVSAANHMHPGTDKSKVPSNLRSNAIVKLTNFAGATHVVPAIKRQLTLNEVMGMGGPLEVLVNNTKWSSDVTEQPVEGTTELWQIINLTADAHPIHLHLVQFQLVSRQMINIIIITRPIMLHLTMNLNPQRGRLCLIIYQTLMVLLVEIPLFRHFCKTELWLHNRMKEAGRIHT